jgi:hypothetical protein
LRPSCFPCAPVFSELASPCARCQRNKRVRRQSNYPKPKNRSFGFCGTLPNDPLPGSGSSSPGNWPDYGSFFGALTTPFSAVENARGRFTGPSLGFGPILSADWAPGCVKPKARSVTRLQNSETSGQGAYSSQPARPPSHSVSPQPGPNDGLTQHVASSRYMTTAYNPKH